MVNKSRPRSSKTDLLPAEPSKAPIGQELLHEIRALIDLNNIYYFDRSGNYSSNNSQQIPANRLRSGLF